MMHGSMNIMLEVRWTEKNSFINLYPANVENMVSS